MLLIPQCLALALAFAVAVGKARRGRGGRVGEEVKGCGKDL
jgi:hypothetical protein